MELFVSIAGHYVFQRSQNDPLATKSNYRSITGRKRRRAIAIIHLPVNCDCDCYVPAITMRLDVPIKKVAHVPETH